MLAGLPAESHIVSELHRLGDRLRVAEVVLLPPGVGTHIFGQHQPSVMA
jgi:hypothetical protein